MFDDDPRKSKGWFSRRHQTAQALTEYREEQENRLATWEATIEHNQQARAKRTAAQQIAVLDKRLGKGKGARKERKRLEAARNA